MRMSKVKFALLGLCLPLVAFGAATPSHAAEGPLRKWLASRNADDSQAGSKVGLYAKGENYQGKEPNDSFGGRDMVVYVPNHLPPAGQRKLVVVLHGGMGNAMQIQSYLGLDPLADKYGFVVAYLNGTQVAGIGASTMLGWNAGECCGLSMKKQIDDVGYITGAVDYIAQKYGIDRNYVYGMGHSNGAMMTQRLMCQTNLYRAALPISAPLEIDVDSCPPSNGKHILALHGAEDENVPIEGGYGPKARNKDTFYNSQAYTQDVYKKSGAYYQLEILEGADHNPKTINESLLKTDHINLPDKIVQFFGLNSSTGATGY
jgi:poly(3-hydroxybutyrate) depolymerase